MSGVFEANNLLLPIATFHGILLLSIAEIPMNKQDIKKIILDQSVTIRRDIDTRRDIESELPRHFIHGLVTIITGMRRVGKSTLLQHIRAHYKQSDFWVDFDDDRFVNFQLSDFQTLLELLIELYGPQNTFFFDEIQNIVGWERFVRRLHDHGYKVFITGSNANMLSRELGTHLTGRYSCLVLYPFSFHEFLRAKQPELLTTQHFNTVTRAQIKKQFNDYFSKGGLPFQLTQIDPDYLSVLYENILYRDIIARYKITTERPIRVLTHYLASNVGKEVSYNKLKDTIQVANHSTVSEYCQYFENSYLCYLVNVYDDSLKKQTRYHKKIYFNDVAMANKIGFRHSEDRGRLLENIVYLELRRRYSEIYFHKNEKECDFLIKEAHQIIAAYQVTLSIDNEDTKKRECNGLIEAMQHHSIMQGYILTEDTEDELILQVAKKKYKIKIMPVWQWLLDGRAHQ